MFNHFKIITKEGLTGDWYIVKKSAWWMPLWFYVGWSETLDEAVALCKWEK